MTMLNGIAFIFLMACPDIRVGKETHCRLFVEAARGMARRGALWC